MKDLILKLIAHLQAMKLCYHNSHHVCGRVAFFADHGAFGDFYSELEDHYDDANERFIGIFGSEMLPFQQIIQQVSLKCQAFPSNSAKDNGTLFMSMLQMENELIALEEGICKSPECKEADKQLFSEIGNKAQMRIYKIKQRVS